MTYNNVLFYLLSIKNRYKNLSIISYVKLMYFTSIYYFINTFEVKFKYCSR